MSIAFHIPTWLLWTVGTVAGAVVLVCAAVGVWFLRNYRAPQI